MKYTVIRTSTKEGEPRIMEEISAGKAVVGRIRIVKKYSDCATEGTD